MPPPATFTTREIHVPDDSDEEDPGASAIAARDPMPWERHAPSPSHMRRVASTATSQHSGGSGGSGGKAVMTVGGKEGQDKLPPLPRELEEMLAMEPPSASSNGLGRTSTSFARPQQPSQDIPASPLLPAVEPHSPLGLPYSPSPTLSASSRSKFPSPHLSPPEVSQPLPPTQGFSSNRTTSPTVTRTLAPSQPSGPLPSFSSSHGAYAPTTSSQSTSFSSRTTPPVAQPQPITPSKRNVFKTLSAFGRSGRTPPPPVPSVSPSGSRSTSASSPSSIRPAWARSERPALSPSSSSSAVPTVKAGTFAHSPSSTSPSSSARPSPALSSTDSLNLPRSTSSPFPHSRAHHSLPLAFSRDGEEQAETDNEDDGDLAAAAAAGSWRRRANTVGGGGTGGGQIQRRGGEQYTLNLEARNGDDEDEEQDEGGEDAAEEDEQEEGEGAELESEAESEVGGGGRRVPERDEDRETKEHERKVSELDLGNLIASLPGSSLPPSSTTPASPPSLADFVVAVIGPRNVGKSTVIKRGLKRPGKRDSVGPGGGAPGPVGEVREEGTRVVLEDEVGNRVTTTTTSFTLGNQRKTIEVLEIDMHLLRYSEQDIVWPEGVPHAEGLMLCYDSTDPSSLSHLSNLLQSFWTRGTEVPLIVLACKAPPPPSSSDSPDAPTSSVVDPREAAAICNVYGAGIVQLDGGLEDPKKKAKQSFNWLIRQILDNRGEIIPTPSSSIAATSPSSSPKLDRRASLRNSTSSVSGAASSFGTTSLSPVSGLPLPLPSSSVSQDGSATPLRPAKSSARSDGFGLGLSVVQEAPVGSVEDLTAGDSFARDGGEGGGLGGGGRESVEEEERRKLDEEIEAAMRVAFDGAEGEGEGRRDANGSGETATTAEGNEAVAETPTVVVKTLPQAGMERRNSKAATATLDLYFQRDDMIDKFLFAAVSGNDEQFVTLFLITYRRFARPFNVVEKLIERFEFVASRHKTDPLLSRFGQMKLCGVLSTWMQNYPGDFTAPSTFGILQLFLESLLPRGATWVAHYALELVPLLAPISALSDPESSWALPDKLLDGAGNATSYLDSVQHAHQHRAQDSSSLPVRPAMSPRRPSLARSYDSSSSLAVSSSQPLSKFVSRLSAHDSIHTTDTTASLSHAGGFALSPSLSQQSRSPRAASEAGTVDTQDSVDGLMYSASAGVGSIGGASGGSGGGGGGLGRRLGKDSQAMVEVSNFVMELREDEVATEITRIAWEMFGGMSPRDLMRHVLAPRDPANPRIALRDSDSKVMRSIAFVNHLAAWVATLILVQSKPKSRARMLEKLLAVALSLRAQENFDSLMGVLAGLNSQPIFRLSETFELVAAKMDGEQGAHRTEQPDGDKTRLPKKLRSLNRLMSANKAFSAYRLALANSGNNLIPYLGVHLQDITVVNEIKKDLRDGKVNWTKFQQMGRSAAIVLDCSRVAPTLPANEQIERAIMNVPLLDEDRQYALSYAHQPRGTATSSKAGRGTGTGSKMLRGIQKFALD